MPTTKAAPRTWRDNADLVAGRRRSNRMDRTWQDNADEFKRTVQGEDNWYLATLIACSVFSGKATDKINSTGVELGKVSTTEFAERAQVTQKTIQRYYSAWAEAIQAGAEIPPAGDLGPDDVGAFPIPARRFNGPGGYAKTRTGSIASGTADGAVQKIIEGGNTLTNQLASSAPAMTKLIDTASPTVIAAVVSEMSDEAFENLTAAVAAATVQPETPAVITKTGVTPAKVTSPAKLTATSKLLAKVEEEKHRKWIEDRAKSGPPRANPRPDGYVPPIVEGLQGDISSLKMWDAVRMHELAEKLLEAVLAYSGPLAPLDEELVVEQLGRVSGTMAKIFEAIEAKKGSTVPDSVPDDWR